MLRASARHMKDDSGTATNPERFLNQDYHQTRAYCLKNKLRFIDEYFPPDSRSIGDGILDPSEMSKVKWERPGVIVHNPSFGIKGFSRFDLDQGHVGDCWFLASIGALTFHDKIFGQVVPENQSFDEDYCGLFHFRFWRFGKWYDVIVDDKLPIYNGRLLFVHSRQQNEFWPALLEKAYAKVCGSYADMNAGLPSEALMDFTGGVHIGVDLPEHPPDVWELMSRAALSGALMGCGTKQGKTSDNSVLPNGLVLAHAYTVTGVYQLLSEGNPVKLVRLYNPWGYEEWNGNWSDNSPLWETVSPEVREKCRKKRDDGEFWMPLEDFWNFYDDLDICSPSPDFLDGGSSCHWKTSSYEGRWVAGTNAGGCINNKESFWTNPQYRVNVEQIDSQCSTTDGEKNMLVSLMQKPDKRNRRLVKNLPIGFSIFEVPEEYKDKRGKFPASFFEHNAPVAQTKHYIKAREATKFLTLKPGQYLIVPSTFYANETASFILTIHSKTETHIHENSSDHDHEGKEVPEPTPAEKEAEKEKARFVFSQHSHKGEPVGAEQLQKLLNETILKDYKSGGFSIDACRSMIALTDNSSPGRLTLEEFQPLWRKVNVYKDIFYRTDVSKDGTVSLPELRNAVAASGRTISDNMLHLMAVRYGSFSGNMTLDSFISLVLRYDYMNDIFEKYSDGMEINLGKAKWMFLSMYS